MSIPEQFEIFDKAKWHFGGDFPKELDIYQAYVHTGLFIGWLIGKGLISEDLKNGCKKEISEFLANKVSPVQFYETQLDGVFSSDDVNIEGYKFTKAYFDFEKGEYLKDYEAALGGELPTLYHVKDSIENFQKISFVLNKRFDEFKKQQNKPR
jgi:hypothetical protein